MKKPVHIGLLIDASRAYGRGICRGVANFADTRDDWLILAHERPELDELPAWLGKARVHGLIAYIPNRKLHAKISSLGVPVVDVHGRCRGGGVQSSSPTRRRWWVWRSSFCSRAGSSTSPTVATRACSFPTSVKRLFGSRQRR